MSAADTSQSDRTAPVLDWLATELSADADLELAALVRHLDELGRPEISRNQFHRCLDLLHTRSLAISGLFRHRFATATLPLTVSLHRSATRLVSALGKIAAGYEEVLAEVRHRLVRTVRRNPEAISAKALEILGEQLTIAHLAGNSAPFEFWLRAHSFFRTSKVDSTPADAAAGQASEGALRAYKYILAFSAAQPEGLTGTEINWLSEYLASSAKSIIIRSALPGEGGFGGGGGRRGKVGHGSGSNRRRRGARQAQDDFVRARSALILPAPCPRPSPPSPRSTTSTPSSRRACRWIAGR